MKLLNYLSLKLPIINDVLGVTKVHKKVNRTLSDADQTLLMVRYFVIGATALIVILILLYIRKHGIKDIFRKK